MSAPVAPAPGPFALGPFALAPEVSGEFETHVTVRCDQADLTGLDQWAATAGVKVTHIVLARGRMTSQPMLTWSGSGTLAAQHRATGRLTDALGAAGFAVVRVKIEAVPWAVGVPVHDAEALRHADAGTYFEHHVKVLLEPDDRAVEELGALASGHRAHLSWNARRVRAPRDGAGTALQERFVTQRCHRVGARTAAARLAALLADLGAAGVRILSVEREFVVYDSDTTIDDGWIAEGGDL
jgi:hypothetical protein